MRIARWALCACLVLCTGSFGVAAPVLEESVRKDALRAISQGLQWLEKRQQPDGHWSLEFYPAITAFVARAMLNDPARDNELSPALRRALDYIASCAKEDGGIYVVVPAAKGGPLRNYNTAACMYTLAASGQQQYFPIVRRAQAFLVSTQRLVRDDYTGGWGYDEVYERPYADIMNTSFAVEALYQVARLLPSTRSQAAAPPSEAAQSEANWTAAAAFLRRCQNLHSAETAGRPISRRPEDAGGFFYHPNRGMAGGETLPDGARIWYSYGNATYLGVLCLLYCGVPRNDPSIVGAIEWIRKHYTVEEHPGLGKQGLYFYYHTMARALSIYGERPLKLADGKEVDWRRDLIVKLCSLQRIDPETGLGYWVNEDGRWMENDPVLVTAYSVLTLEQLLEEPAP